MIRLTRYAKYSRHLVAAIFFCLIAAPALAQTSARDYREQGLERYQKNDFNGAIESYSKAIEIDPKSALAHDMRGIAFVRLKKYRESLKDFDQAINLDPKFAGAHLNRSGTKLYLRDFKGAIVDADRSLALKPGSTLAYSNRAMARAALGEFDAALADATQAIKLDSKNASAYLTRGTVKYHKGDFAGALAEYNSALQIQSSHEVYYNIGLAKTALKDYKGSITDFTKALQLRPNVPKAHLDRALAYYNIGAWPQSLQDFRRLQQIDSQNQNEYDQFYIWMIRTRTGEAEAATAELKAYFAARKTGKPGDWESQIGAFLVGDLTETEFLGAAENADPKDAANHKTEAYFYAGTKRRLAGENDIAGKYFQASLNQKQTRYNEYASAEAELSMLKGPGPTRPPVAVATATPVLVAAKPTPVPTVAKPTPVPTAIKPQPTPTPTPTKPPQPTLVQSPESKELSRLRFEAQRLLLAADYEKLEDKAEEYRTSKASFSTGVWKLTAFYAGATILPGDAKGNARAIARLRTWVEMRPYSVTAAIALAEALVNLSWIERGSGNAEGTKRMKALLQECRLILREAKKLDEKCPHWWTVTLSVGRGQGWDVKTFDGLFAEAIAFEAAYTPHYFERLTYALPTWRGATGDWEKFALESSEKLEGDKGDVLYARLIWYLDSKRLPGIVFREPAISWQKLERGFEALLKQQPNNLTLKSEWARLTRLISPTGSNAYRPRAKELFTEIGLKVDDRIWSGITEFQQFRKWAVAE